MVEPAEGFVVSPIQGGVTGEPAKSDQADGITTGDHGAVAVMPETQPGEHPNVGIENAAFAGIVATAP